MRDRVPLPLRLTLARLRERVLSRPRSRPQPAVPEKPPNPANRNWDWNLEVGIWVSPWFPREREFDPFLLKHLTALDLPSKPDKSDTPEYRSE